MLIHLWLEDVDGEEVELEVRVTPIIDAYESLTYDPRDVEIVDAAGEDYSLSDFGPWERRVGEQIDLAFDDRRWEARIEERDNAMLASWEPYL